MLLERPTLWGQGLGSLRWGPGRFGFAPPRSSLPLGQAHGDALPVVLSNRFTPGSRVLKVSPTLSLPSLFLSS